MPNPNGAKGNLFETEVTKALNAAGIAAIKPRQAGVHDIGDIHLLDDNNDIILQAKAWANLAAAITAGTAGATKQAGHAKKPFGFAVIKKPRGAILDAYVVMHLRDFIRFLKR